MSKMSMTPNCKTTIKEMNVLLANNLNPNLTCWKQKKTHDHEKFGIKNWEMSYTLDKMF